MPRIAQLSRPTLKIALCGTLACGISLHLFAQEDKPLRLDVKLVSLFVNVTDESGVIIGGLGKDDFQVREDGRLQSIKVFEGQSELPLNLALAIDTSSSTYKDRAIERDAAKKFVHTLMRPQDQMCLLEFSTYVTELTRGFTNKVRQVDRALDHIRGEGGTALYETVFLGSEELGKREGRKVLVLVTDGGDTVRSTTYKQAEEQALRNEVMIYSIIDVPVKASAGRDIGGEHALVTLAEQTGGKRFYVDAEGLDKAFAGVSDDLRSQYLIGYYPNQQEPGQVFHRIEVTIPRSGGGSFNIRHKTGYYGDSVAKKK